MRSLRARGSAELRKVASGSGTLGLWLENGKVGSQVVGKDRTKPLGEEQLGKLEKEEEDEEEEPATERKKDYSDLGSDLGEREEQVACHASALALAMTDEAHRKQRCRPDDLHCFYERQKKPYVFH